jgi:WD40 repeat protein
MKKLRARIIDHLSGGVATKDIRKHLDSLVSEDRYHALNQLPTRMVKANRLEQFYQWLTDFDFIEAKIFHPEISIQALIEDYSLALGSEILFSSEQASVLRLIQEALLLSVHVLNEDKRQLAGQLLGRLLSFENLEEIQKLLQQAQQSKNICLVPQTPSLTPPGGALVRTLTGHQSFVSAVAITSDNKYVISASCDNTLKVWNWQTGEQLRTLTGHSGSVNAVVITSDNKYAISASWDETLKVWDWQTGEQLRTLTGHSDSVNAVAITSDNKYAISASRDNTLKVWDLQTGEQLHTLTGHSKSVNAVAITSDNKYAISASMTIP